MNISNILALNKVTTKTKLRVRFNLGSKLILRIDSKKKFMVLKISVIQTIEAKELMVIRVKFKPKELYNKVIVRLIINRDNRMVILSKEVMEKFS